jgi:predicted O-linked N-acetylglucosamine transferase (SPINDLY family)
VQKINPAVFGVWMEVLRRVPQTVLWLANLSHIARNNLGREAAKRNVAVERLIFGEPLAQNADHLARYRHVDLALDTFPYGSHSTAADALWVGAPLVALVGESFVSRVSGSVLTAGGLPELITHDLERYRDLILELAGDAARRQALRERLQEGRSRCALFDTPRFVRALEDAYERMARGPVEG